MPNGSKVVSLDDARRRREADSQSLGAAALPHQHIGEGLRYGGLAQQGLAISQSIPLPSQEGEARPRGLVEGFVKTCQRWMLSPEQQAVLIGYKENALGASDILAGRVKIPSQDVKDRMRFLVRMSLTLGALFNEVADSEVVWLHAKRVAFDGRSALDVLLQGRMTDVLAVVRFAESEREP
jgi:hypothetical protein